MTALNRRSSRESCRSTSSQMHRLVDVKRAINDVRRIQDMGSGHRAGYGR